MTTKRTTIKSSKMNSEEPKNIDESIVDNAKMFIKELFKKKLPVNVSFHSYSHAREVAAVARELGEKADLNSDEIEILELSAWFHDSGYISNREQHETESVEIATTFLKSKNYDSAKTKKITELILSTRLEHEPSNILEEILHDADIFHVGKKKFFSKGELLRAELEGVEHQTFTEIEWQEKQYNFLINNPFITIYAKKEFNSRRAKNIKKQREQILKAKKLTRRLQTGKDFGRGIDTLYRSSYRNHINLSSIADGKANMMISINTILISVIVTFSGASFSVFEGLELPSLRYTVPILILLISSLISVFFAVMSARPKITEKDVSKRKVKKRNVSLLFFGNFLEISRKQYIDHLSALKNNQKELYDSMSMDIYNLGVVLKEKYRLLTISYTVFIIGITLCVVGYIGIFLFTNLL